MKSIKETQDEIIAEFEPLLEFGDRELVDDHLWELGKKLPPLAEEHKVERNVIKGCQSTVYLVAWLDKGRVFYNADSNTGFTKGIVSLLIRVLSGHRPEEIMEEELYFIDQIGIRRFLSSQRNNGLNAMIKQMKLYALAFNEKVKNI